MSTDHEIEEALKTLADGRRRIAVVYEKGKGWCVTDDMDVLEPKMGPRAPEYRVIAYTDWFCKTLGDAVAKLRHIRVLRAQAEADLNRNR